MAVEPKAQVISRRAASSATYLRSLALAGFGEVGEARAVLAQWATDLEFGGAKLSILDCVVASAAMLVAEGTSEEAARLLGSARGNGDGQLSPISFAIHRHYLRTIREHLPPERSRRLYDDGRSIDPLLLVHEMLGLSWDPSAQLMPSCSHSLGRPSGTCRLAWSVPQTSSIARMSPMSQRTLILTNWSI